MLPVAPQGVKKGRRIWGCDKGAAAAIAAATTDLTFVAQLVTIMTSNLTSRVQTPDPTNRLCFLFKVH